MDGKKEIFADGIGHIHFTGGMVRIDLMRFDADGEPESKPVPVSKERIIMPPEGFLRSFRVMQALIDQLVQKGVVQEKEGVANEKEKGRANNKKKG